MSRPTGYAAGLRAVVQALREAGRPMTTREISEEALVSVPRARDIVAELIQGGGVAPVLGSRPRTVEVVDRDLLAGSVARSDRLL